MIFSFGFFVMIEMLMLEVNWSGEVRLKLVIFKEERENDGGRGR